MSRFHGPKISTEGLVLCLDAANAKSYPGSGATWSDMSGNGYNLTLTNSPSTSIYGLSLNGTNQYAYVNHGGNLGFSSGNFTISVWHRNNDSSTTFNGIISNDNTGDNAWKIFRDSGQSYYNARSGATFTTAFPAYTVNRFHHYAYTFNAGTVILYFDGAVVSTNSSVASPTSQNFLVFGSYRYNDALSNSFLANQTIGATALYNRALTKDEILQNYNLTKSRFLR